MKENPMFDKSKAIEETYNNFWNVRDELKDKTLEELQTISLNDRLPFAVCVINITGDLNVGMMMRTACLMGAERFIIFGRKKYDRRSTVGAHNYIEVVRVDAMADDRNIDVVKFNLLMNRYNYKPIFFETNGKPLSKFHLIRDFYAEYYCNINSLSLKPCLVFGNEGFGLPAELLKDNIVLSIEQRGVLRSLNVSSAAAIAMYEIARQLA